MAFHFPLQSILHFRQSVEHQEELRLRAANQHVARIRHLIEQVDLRMVQARDLSARELAAGTTSAEVCFGVETERLLEAQRHELESQLVRAVCLRTQQQLKFQQARREREIFQSLRDRQRREYEQESRHKEQSWLDDIYLLRRAYVRRG